MDLRSILRYEVPGLAQDYQGADMAFSEQTLMKQDRAMQPSVRASAHVHPAPEAEFRTLLARVNRDLSDLLVQADRLAIACRPVPSVSN